MRIFTLSTGRLRRLSIRALVACCTAGLLASLTGCASQPPIQNALSGKRLIFTATFSGFINPIDHYFFLINNAGAMNAPGPVPVLVPPYGNGFAAGSGGVAGGFTDFVRFDALQPGNSGYTLYHVLGDPSLSRFVNLGSPISATRPSTDGASLNGKQLRFEIDLSQIIVDSNGAPLSTSDAATMARGLKYLQINIVSTDQIPTDVTTQIAKRVDSLGDTRTSSSASSFLIIDLTQNRVYKNSDFAGQSIEEPTDYDVFGQGTDDSLDLRDWSVEVRQQ